MRCTPMPWLLALTVGVALSLTGMAHAQERSSTGMTTQRGEQQLERADVVRSQSQRDDVQTLINRAAGPCGGHAYNSTWSEDCPSGFTGQITKTCLQNVAIIKTNTCKRMEPCGSQPHGSTWSVACLNNLTGSMTARCFNGQTGYVGFSCH